VDQPAEAVVDRQRTLVNLDCDNIIGARCIESAMALFGISVGGKRSVSVMWRGQESSTTGRIGYRADLWTALRGYDEADTMGSGSQDIDMPSRCKAFVGNQIFARYSRGGMDDNHKVLGHPLPQ
jgi:hypothetical protein